MPSDGQASGPIVHGSVARIYQKRRPQGSPRNDSIGGIRKRILAYRMMTKASAPESQLVTELVGGLVHQVDKCLRAMTLYSPSHPMYLRAVAELQSGFEPVWAELVSLTLQVRDDGFAWQSNLVLREDHTPDSISWRLFREGIRSITLTRGVEDEEILRLLGVIHRSRYLAEDDEDDLLTLLWDQYFEHVRYRVIDPGSDDVAEIEGPASSDPPPSPEETREQVEEEVAEVMGPDVLADFDDFDASLYFLDDHEIGQIKDDIATEFTQDICVNTLSMFLDVLELHPSRDVREETCSVLEELFSHLVGTGDFGSIAYLIRELRVLLARVTDLELAHRKTLGGLARKLSDPKVISLLLRSMDHSVMRPTPADLQNLFGEPEPEALMVVVKRIPQLEDEAAKVLLRSALGHQATHFPKVIREALTSEDEEIVLVGLRCVEERKLTSVHAELQRLSQHEDTAVRRALVAALGGLRTSEAVREIEELLHDRDHDIRIAAVRALSTCGDAATRSLVEAIVLGRAIRDTDRSEKLAFFETYAALFGESATAGLEPLLHGGLFRRRSDAATRACVARALGKVGGPAAKATLEKALSEKAPLYTRSALASAE